jgi:hypothetical protein
MSSQSLVEPLIRALSLFCIQLLETVTRTLVAFDLKGAFNGVNKSSLEARRKTKGIPTIARRWISSFMEDRKASIGFNDFETSTAPLPNAG